MSVTLFIFGQIAQTVADILHNDFNYRNLVQKSESVDHIFGGSSVSTTRLSHAKLLSIEIRYTLNFTNFTNHFIAKMSLIEAI